MIMRVRIRQEGKKRAVCDYEGLGGIALSLKEGPYFKDLGPRGVPKMALGVLGHTVFVLKSGLKILIWAPEAPFSVPPK